MIVLVINCGSSSAKYQLFDADRRISLAKGVVERIGQYGSGCRDHHAAIRIIVDRLTAKGSGIITSVKDIRGVGHRVVHGGEEFKESTLINKKVLESIDKYKEIAPLHNPPSLLGIKACSAILKGIPQVAVFDTSFHQTMPEAAFLYGLPLECYHRYGLRKYGFHGTSHRYVSEEAARILGKPKNKLKMITCHLGNGCSMTAVDGGRSVDTSMGFTPLEGLIMGTRSGDLDPAAVLVLIEKEGASTHTINDLLNKKSGLLGISGVSNDMRDILKGAKGKGPEAARCRLALEMFTYRIKKYIGAYMAAMGGLDAVVFTAGISENNPWLIERLEKELSPCLPSGAKFMVVPTNEELLIAQDTFNIIKKRKGR
jgi:acetate kinase